MHESLFELKKSLKEYGYDVAGPVEAMYAGVPESPVGIACQYTDDKKRIFIDVINLKK